jgi:ubiquinol-cytochrome c reductase cytochrome c1 subunit
MLVLTNWVLQRPASTSSAAAEEAASAWKSKALPTGATVFAIGTVAWYWHLFGRNVDAMTPAEEG